MAIPEELKAIPQWVCALEGSKCPMKAFEHGAASSSDPDTWSDYETALTAVTAGVYDNVGFVFNNNDIVGIDIDTGFDEDGLLSQTAAHILGLCQSYTEYSRSGRGFHVLVRGHLPFDGKNNRAGVEIYQTGRYFILTGKSLVFPDEIIENQPAIDKILTTYFLSEPVEKGDRPIIQPRIYSPQWSLPEQGRVKLRPEYPRISPGSRNICLTSLAGLLHTQGYNKSQIYDELKYCNESACDPPLDRRELKSIVNSVTRYKR